MHRFVCVAPAPARRIGAELRREVRDRVVQCQPDARRAILHLRCRAVIAPALFAVDAVKHTQGEFRPVAPEIGKHAAQLVAIDAARQRACPGGKNQRFRAFGVHRAIPGEYQTRGFVIVGGKRCSRGEPAFQFNRIRINDVVLHRCKTRRRIDLHLRQQLFDPVVTVSRLPLARQRVAICFRSGLVVGGCDFP